MRNYISTLNNMVFVPIESIYRGDNQFDFIVYDDKFPDVCKEKLKEVDETSAIKYKKSGFTKKTKTELIKDGSDPGKGKPPKEKK